MKTLRSLAGIAVTVVIAAALSASGSARVEGEEVRTLTPVADAFVVAAAPRADTRRERVLLVSAKPVRHAYVTFAQPIEPGSLVSATLELHVRHGGEGLRIARTVSPWSGGQLTFASVPKPQPPGLRQRRLRSGSRFALDVTSLVRSRGQVTFVLSSASGRLALWSAQAGAELAPTLTVVTRTEAEQKPPNEPLSPIPQPIPAPIPQPTPPPSSPTPPAGDATPPSTPSNLHVGGRGQTTLTVVWSPATDDTGVTAYRVALGVNSASTSQLSHRFEALACGASYDATVWARDAAGNESAPAVLAASTEPCPTVAVAGDIADNTNGDEITASLVDALAPTLVLTTGDNVYPDGKLSEFISYYEPTWGRHRGITRPSPGNHEYRDPGAAGYFAYFGAAAGPAARGYYSFDLGTWHLISLNSEIAHDAGSEQLAWLRADLAATTEKCVLAYWHRPRFTAANYNDFESYTPFWQELYNAGAELALAGHDHNYQRYERLDPVGVRDDLRGLREFVVGTGGRRLYPLGADPRRAAGTDSVHGVLELTLRADGYAWRFVGQPGSSFEDSGSDSCH